MRLHPDLEKYIDNTQVVGMISSPFVFGVITDKKSIPEINMLYISAKCDFETMLKSGRFIEAIDKIKKWWYIELLHMYSFTEQQTQILLDRAWNHLMDKDYHHTSVDPRWEKLLIMYPKEFFLSDEYMKSDKYKKDIEWFDCKMKIQKAHNNTDV